MRHLILENAAGVLDDVNTRKGLFYLFSPQRVVQTAGPFGPKLVARNCAEGAARCPYDGEALIDYYYHLSNAPLSGQRAFECILTPRSWHFPLLPRLEHLKVPTTIIWGVQDGLLSLHHGLRLHQGIVESNLILLPEARHSPHAEDPEAFNEAVIGTVS